MRLQKYMAMCGVAARRKCEEIIAAGRVCVNGVIVTEMGTQVEDGDEVKVDGAVIHPEEEKRYIIYHKPAGEVTTVSDEKGRETVMDRYRLQVSCSSSLLQLSESRSCFLSEFILIYLQIHTNDPGQFPGKQLPQ